MIVIDMEMPGDCRECPLYDEYGYCVVLGVFAAEYGQHTDCPLREENDVLTAQRKYIDELQDRFRKELGEANREVKRLEDENAALAKMLKAASLQGRQGW